MSPAPAAERASRGRFVVLVAVVLAVAAAAGALVARAADAPQAVVAAQAPASPVDAHGSESGATSAVPATVDPQRLPLGSERQVRAEPVMDGDTAVFKLTAEQVRWELVPGEWITAWGYDGQIPGPAALDARPRSQRWRRQVSRKPRRQVM